MDNEGALALIEKRIPSCVLSTFKEESFLNVYHQFLKKLIEESLPEGSTILQILVAERAAYHFIKVRQIEEKEESTVSAALKFYTYEYNRNMEILRQLSIRNLPAQQAAILAKKTIRVIERLVKNPSEKDEVIKELIQEFTLEIPINVPDGGVLSSMIEEKKV